MANLAAYLITALTISDGLLLTYLVLDDASFGFRLAAGTVTGLAFLAHFAFLLALAFGLNTASIAFTTLILVAALAWLWWKQGERLRADVARYLMADKRRLTLLLDRMDRLAYLDLQPGCRLSG